MTGCLGTRHLKEGELLLYRQRIVAPGNLEQDKLKELYVQKTNRKLFGDLTDNIPLHYLVSIYYTGKRFYKQEKFIRKKEKIEKKFNNKIASVPESNIRRINNLQFRKLKKINTLEGKIENGNTVMQWGEPPSVYDSGNVALTAERFRAYLFSNGYFQNKVTYQVDTIKTKMALRKHRNHMISVTYFLEPGKAYFIDSILYAISDTTIYSLVKKHERYSFIKKGDRYDQNNFTNERERIDLTLKDLGYYDFSRQYIEFNVDSTILANQKLVVMISIKDPAKRGYHKKFIIDKVNFTTDASVTLQGLERKGRRYRNIDYKFYADNYNLRILSQRVFILPGQEFNRTRTFNTQRQLANLDAFKFVNINYDTTGGTFIANIFTSPLDRYQWSNEIGMNVTQGYPGPFYNISLKKRNVFRGLETFDLTGRIGFEGVASPTNDQNIYKSTEAGINASMTFPQLIFPLRERRQILLGKYNPKTRVQIGYAYTDRPEYRRTNASFSATYLMENKRTTQYSLTFDNINIIDTVKTSAEFSRFLESPYALGNFNLVNAFSPSVINSIIFGITWNHNNYGAADKNATFIRATLESGGTLWNVFSPDIITENGLQYYKYFRLGLDIRKNHVVDKNTVVAYRFNSGAAYGYGANNSVPYEKFFFVGGSNSIRAWRPRRLGPGSYKPDISENPSEDGLFDYNIEKPAEILLEASIELRKKLFGFVDGAVFLDAGNVWTVNNWIKRDDNGQEVDNGNSQFRLDRFYKEIGLGTGFGLRFDFTFLILRFDVGIKVFDPARDPGDKFVLHKMKFFSPFDRGKEPVIYNVGIGFPF